MPHVAIARQPPTNFAAATVTETALLRGQVKDLQVDVEILSRNLALSEERAKDQEQTIQQLRDELYKLRRQIQAFRDGVMLVEEP